MMEKILPRAIGILLLLVPLVVFASGIVFGSGPWTPLPLS